MGQYGGRGLMIVCEPVLIPGMSAVTTFGSVQRSLRCVPAAVGLLKYPAQATI